MAVEVEERRGAGGQYLRVGAVSGGVVFVIDLVAEIALDEFCCLLLGEGGGGALGAVAAGVALE